jgi:hypothetical protein
VIKGQRVSDKQKADPRSVETMDILAIKETPSISFYSGLGNLKGVDLTTASLGFTIINTRGFNSTSPVRSLQLIDGVDNQAPGLNFSLGNFLGVSELDILKLIWLQSKQYFINCKPSMELLIWRLKIHFIIKACLHLSKQEKGIF